MRAKRRDSLKRLLNPRHIAVFGGGDAEIVIGECDRIGFDGPVWPVNPKRAEIAGRACFATLDDLPEVPDASFIAVPRDAAIDIVASLALAGAGGAVCYTAGFGEVGNGDAEAELARAAGDLALLGANCYGLINFLDDVALWPFARGGATPRYGAAIITQSGMLGSDLTMSQRGVPFAYMVSVGNQTVLAIEDFIDVLSDDERVRAIGLHIEGLRDVAAFEAAALKALERDVPVVALKTGSSQIGAALTVSHTGSLSGSDDLYSALFDRLGIIRADDPAQMLETLKFLTVAGIPEGTRVAGFTCSGGGATMLADRGERIGLAFPEPGAKTAQALRHVLPHTATVSNPLDYTTPVWGDRDRLTPIIEAALDGGHDAAVMVQDYPLPGLDESKPLYLADAQSFVDAAKRARVPAAICSTLPENLDAATRDLLVAEGIAPMQGLTHALDAIAHAAWYGARRKALRADRPPPLVTTAGLRDARALDEAAGKALLARAGIDVPEGRVVDGSGAPAAAAALGFPVALKLLHADLAHKTDIGAVALGLGSADDVEAAVQDMRDRVTSTSPDLTADRFLVERMVVAPVAELLVGIVADAQFGLAMTLASGGVLVELIGDAATVLLPATRADIAMALDRLKLAPLLDGYRGRPAADRDCLLDSLERLAALAVDRADEIAEIEINPLFVLPEATIAIDAAIRLAGVKR